MTKSKVLWMIKCLGVITFILLSSISWANSEIAEDVKYMEGKSRFEKGQYIKAVEVLNEAISVNPDEYKYHDLIARAYYMLNRKDEAKTHFERVVDLVNEILERNSDEVKYHMIIGYAYKNLEQKEKAKKHYDQAMALNPDDVMVYVSRSSVSSDLEEEEFWLKKAIEKFPFRAAPYAVLISHYTAKAIEKEASGDTENAIKLLEESRRLINDYLLILEEDPHRLPQEEQSMIPMLKKGLKGRLKSINEAKNEWEEKYRKK